MTARQTLTILAEIAELDAKRAKLVAELRRVVADDELDRAIRTDPVLRDIFRPAEDLSNLVKELEQELDHGK